MTNYESIDDIFVSLAEMLRPPERLSVAEAAVKHRRLNNPGAYVGPWTNTKVPYMVEPMNTFASTIFTGMIFVGPAQCAKTDALILNTVTYTIKVDPMDMMVVCPTNTAARDFSMRRIDRLHQHSQDIGSLMLPGADNDNTFDKRYVNGMILSLSWPTPTELAGKPIGRVVLTDRDRMPDDIDGDGEPFDLAAKRTTTYMSNAMTVAESSPSRPVTDMKWIAKTPHEAPPCAGIIGLYNRGDRRRWYWPCPECDRYFEGRWEQITYDTKKGMTNLEIGETARMECPHCHHHIHPDDRHEMNLWGIWLKDGQGIDKEGRVFGPEPRTLTASFWLRGVAAAFTDWKKLTVIFLDANDHYERTGDEESLTKFYNNDLGEPYYPKSSEDLRAPEDLISRADKVPDHLAKHVPLGVRFLEATIDVQKNSFQVCVFGVLPGRPYDTVVIERFAISKSKRLDDDGDPLPVRPATYLEDWDLITEQVIYREYPLADESGRLMGIKMVGCDSGGQEGVTGMAYNYYRKLRLDNNHRRFTLLKGDPSPNQPRTRIVTPDSSQKGPKAVARGDVPVLMLNSNALKDDLNGRLDCILPGKGMYRTPDWLPVWFYNELCSEIRTEKGWEHTSSGRNEQWDLSYYMLGLNSSTFLKLDYMDWNNPPSWAAEWDKNDFVRSPNETSIVVNNVKSRVDFADFGKSLA